jgi:ribosomal-protein-alanine N-acetyltransferase
MALVVREASAGDVGLVIEIWRLLMLSPWPRGDIDAEIVRPDSIFLVAAADNSDVRGFILGRTTPAADPEAGLEAEIYNIGVSPEYGNSGIGSLLLTAFIERCRAAGAGRVWLEVRVSNATAIKFYRKHGFIEAGSRKGFYRDPVEDALIMYLSAD